MVAKTSRTPPSSWSRLSASWLTKSALRRGWDRTGVTYHWNCTRSTINRRLHTVTRSQYGARSLSRGTAARETGRSHGKGTKCTLRRCATWRGAVRNAPHLNSACRGIITVADIGSAGTSPIYRDIFSEQRGFKYVGVDMVRGPNVDIVMKAPYEFPLADQSFDLVISGQMFEHCEFFWVSFTEMVRILKPGGYIFLIAPSTGPVHRAPFDCWRFYPDAYAALTAKSGKMRVCRRSWTDMTTKLEGGQRHIWHDMVGVFRRYPSMLNLALNKPALQSSTSRWSRSRFPEQDARGANNGIISREEGFHTAHERNPWWQVDLEEEFCVKKFVTIQSQKLSRTSDVF